MRIGNSDAACTRQGSEKILIRTRTTHQLEQSSETHVLSMQHEITMAEVGMGGVVASNSNQRRSGRSKSTLAALPWVTNNGAARNHHATSFTKRIGHCNGGIPNYWQQQEESIDLACAIVVFYEQRSCESPGYRDFSHRTVFCFSISPSYYVCPSLSLPNPLAKPPSTRLIFYWKFTHFLTICLQ